MRLVLKFEWISSVDEGNPHFLQYRVHYKYFQNYQWKINDGYASISKILLLTD